MHEYHPPADTGLDIVYQDNEILVVNKLPGLLSVPGKGEHKQDCLESRVTQRFPTALIAHRLDMSTSGLMLFALTPDIQRQLHRLFAERKVSKHYIAIVTGQLIPRQGSIDLPLITDWPNRPKQMVNFERGKPSLTHYEALSYDVLSHSSRVMLTPVTGRSHQLRVHLMSLGHAILGDEFYASESVYAQAERLLLHASSLSFTHPSTGATLALHSPAPF